MPDKETDLPQRILIAVGALLGLLAVVGGTFAAHVLDNSLDPKSINTFDVAVRYHMYHALATLVAAWVYTRWPGRLPLMAGWMFVAGVVLFSGGLYVLVGTGAKWLGVVAPIGGSAFIIGWLLLALAVLIPSTPRRA
jgi:uncharacterized membrane protein YgdD (TMEM256/DUF423 family)